MIHPSPFFRSAERKARRPPYTTAASSARINPTKSPPTASRRRGFGPSPKEPEKAAKPVKEAKPAKEAAPLYAAVNDVRQIGGLAHYYTEGMDHRLAAALAAFGESA